ncbi:MAG: cell division protein FtsA [Alphaproteobacteria bacterium]
MRSRHNLIAALDVGSTKVCCFVAKPERELRVIGFGHHASRGIKGGTIANMEQAEASVVSAVHAAEQMAGETIHSVLVNLSGGLLASDMRSIEVSIAGHEVGDADMRRALAQGRAGYAEPDRELIHSIPIGYTIDGTRGIRDPRGMYGDKLGVAMHLVSAASGAVRNLSSCVGRCHLDIESFVVSPYASGLACLVEDEIDLGVTCIDMGGGTTTIAVFLDGNVVYTDGVALGGAHVTNDIARGLSCSLAHAERMKTLYGSAIASPRDDQEIIDVPLIGEDNPAQANHVPKSLLTGIIQPRVEETLELVRDRLEGCGFNKLAGRRVVLTGGASQLQGVRELAAQVLDKQVRLGRPIRIHGLAESAGGPAFSTAAGMLAHAMRSSHGQSHLGRGLMVEPNRLIARLGHWLKENF